MKNELPSIIVIVGPTASGKTKLAVKLAQQFNGEIVSADSRQVYKGMDIGSGKDLADYQHINYHLLSIASPRQVFTLARFQKLADQAITKIIKKNKLPILCGGTGLYAEAVFDGYLLTHDKPQNNSRKKLQALSLTELQSINKKHRDYFNNSDWNNPIRHIRFIESKQSSKTNAKKEKYQPLIFAVRISKDKLLTKIKQRLNKRLKQGLIEEVVTLHKSGLSWKRLESFGLEYKIISYYLQNKISYSEMKAMIVKDSLNFAKRQLTWLNRPVLKNRIIWVENYKQLKENFRQQKYDWNNL